MTTNPGRTRKNQGFRLVAGFLFTASLIVAMLSFNLYKLTSFSMVEKIGVGFAQEVVDIQSLAELYYPIWVEDAQQDPDAEVVIPGVDIGLGVKVGELLAVPKDETGDFVARAVMKRIYYDGLNAVYDGSIPDMPNREDLEGLVYTLDTFVNKEFNDRMFLLFVVATLLCIASAVPFFVFSPAFLKLTGFGGSLMIAGVPGIFLTLVRSQVDFAVRSGQGESSLVDGAILPFLSGMQVTYLAVLLVGLGLFLSGVSGMFITRRKKPAAG